MTRRELLIATNNKGKQTEFRQLLADLPLTISDLSSFPAIDPISETGRTFEENASLKASGYAIQAKRLTLADDSGLEVDALNGAPGVLSSRYGPVGASDESRSTRLLAELTNVPVHDRSARFVSVIAIAGENGELINLSSGICEGLIALTPRGGNGFGYDPIFIPSGFNETFGELPAEVKNRVSHRAQAWVRALEFLRTLTASPDDR